MVYNYWHTQNSARETLHVNMRIHTIPDLLSRLKNIQSWQLYEVLPRKSNNHLAHRNIEVVTWFMINNVKTVPSITNYSIKAWSHIVVLFALVSGWLFYFKFLEYFEYHLDYYLNCNLTIFFFTANHKASHYQISLPTLIIKTSELHYTN